MPRRSIGELVHVAVLVVALAILAWGVIAWSTYGEGTLRETPTPLAAKPPATPAGAPDASLPRAWVTPEPTPTWTPTNTPTQTATPDRPTATRIPSPTLTPLPTATPSPTATPIHAPASSEPTRLTIPAIALDTKVIPVGIKEQYQDGVLRRVWDVADYAAGFHSGMALPGHVGNTVISGHNNIRGSVFENLHKLKPGDDVYLWVGDVPYRYKVSAIYRLPIQGAPPDVLQDNIRFIQPTDDQRLTLTTCWPPWSNTHRTVVVAFPEPWE